MTDWNKIPSVGTGTGSSVTSTSVNSRGIHFYKEKKKEKQIEQIPNTNISQILIVYF